MSILIPFLMFMFFSNHYRLTDQSALRAKKEQAVPAIFWLTDGLPAEGKGVFADILVCLDFRMFEQILDKSLHHACKEIQQQFLGNILFFPCCADLAKEDKDKLETGLSLLAYF